MELAIAAYFNTVLPLDDRLAMIRDAGFPIISVWGEYPPRQGYLDKAGLERIRQGSERYGLKIHSVHSPFERANDLASDDETLRRKRIEDLKECVRNCAELNAEYLIVHLQRSNLDARDKVDVVVSGMQELYPLMQQTGVKVAVENMLRAHTVEVLDRVMEQLPEEFVICYDSSHDRLAGDQFSILSRWGSRICVSHLSDNNGVRDDHLLPWEGSIDWERFVQEFPWKAFPGPLLMETEMVLSAVTDPVEFLRETRERGSRLLEMRNWK